MFCLYKRPLGKHITEPSGVRHAPPSGVRQERVDVPPGTPAPTVATPSEPSGSRGQVLPTEEDLTGAICIANGLSALPPLSSPVSEAVALLSAMQESAVYNASALASIGFEMLPPNLRQLKKYIDPRARFQIVRSVGKSSEVFFFQMLARRSHSRDQ